jgi:PilZ domain-containing protein
MMPEASYLTPRTAPRFSFVAEAEVMGQGDGGTHMVARISELSARGCYVDTVNPFPVDSKLRFLIRYGCSVCELTGKVLYTHTGFGMGVLFEEIAPQHRATLEAWLAEIARKLA